MNINIFIMIVVTIVFVISLFLNYFGSRAKYGKNIESISSVSDKYFTMITPAKITFAIWGLIYILAIIVLAIWWNLLVNSGPESLQIFQKVIGLFAVICILNPLWIIFWTRDDMNLALVTMIVLFVLLAITTNLVNNISDEYIFWLRMFFHIYLGWISVALSVNIAAFLCSTRRIDCFSTTAMYWSIAMIVILSILALYMLVRQNNIAYTSVICWALFGIYLQKNPHTLPFPSIKFVSLGMSIFLLISIICKFIYTYK